MHLAVDAPIIYPCHGCALASQLAESLATRLSARGLCEVGSLRGSSQDRIFLLAAHRAGRPIVALDACALRCVGNLIKREGIRPEREIVLTEFGVGRVDELPLPDPRFDAVLEMIAGRLETIPPRSERP